MCAMKLDFRGRLRKVNLSPNMPLVPVYEAIANGIDSIEESGRDDGVVCVNLVRDNSDLVAMDNDDFKRVFGFVVVDNGCGFTDSNFESFESSDSTKKIEKGGKGVGRLTWLKAFASAKIDSVYGDNGKRLRRKFEFLSDSGVANVTVENTTDDVLTRVELVQFKDEFSKNCPKSLDAIANRVLNHFIFYYVVGLSPDIRVRDGVREVCLRTLYRNNVSGNCTDVKVEINEECFDLKFVRVFASERNANFLSLCACNRVVQEFKMDRYNELLKRKIVNGDESFYLSCYMSGVFLDEHVNQERTAFAIGSKDAGLMAKVSYDDIHEVVKSEVDRIIDPLFNNIRKKHRDKVAAYIAEERPQFRYILEYEDGLIDRIPIGIKRDGLDYELQKIMLDKTREINREIKKMADIDPGGIGNVSEYREKISKVTERVNSIGKGKLADYVIERKVILELLDMNLRVKHDGGYQKEEVIHKMLYPMRKCSNEIDYSQQNLWILDERLSYHRFLYSDVPLSEYKELELEGEKRPDMAIYRDMPAFTSDSGGVHGSLTIVEFKRPGNEPRNNPVEQIHDYIRRFKAGKIRTSDGRPIIINDATRFFGYILCEYTKDFFESVKYSGFRMGPDGLGMYCYNTELHIYLEIISFEKLLQDAKMRNQIFFERLNIA